jgi:hypothetical protein
MNRKELTVFVQTTDEDTELSVSSTRSGVVVVSLPNGIRFGVDPEHLINALYDIQVFKRMSEFVATTSLQSEPPSLNLLED